MNNINPISTPPFAYAGEVSLNKDAYKKPSIFNMPQTSTQEQPVVESNDPSILSPIINKNLKKGGEMVIVLVDSNNNMLIQK